MNIFIIFSPRVGKSLTVNIHIYQNRFARLQSKEKALHPTQHSKFHLKLISTPISISSTIIPLLLAISGKLRAQFPINIFLKVNAPPLFPLFFYHSFPSRSWNEHKIASISYSSLRNIFSCSLIPESVFIPSTYKSSPPPPPFRSLLKDQLYSRSFKH